MYPDVVSFGLSFSLSESGDVSMALQSWSYLTSAKTGSTHTIPVQFAYTTLELHPTPIAGDTEKLLQHPVFCALHLLNVKCETLDLLDAFFKTLSIAPKILSFSIANVMDCARALLPSISRVSNAYANGVLGHLQIEVNVLDLDAVNPSIDAATFQSICTFYNLRKLNFQSEPGVQLDDTALCRWPRLGPSLKSW